MFRDSDKQFDKHFARVQKTIWISVIANSVIGIGVLIFCGWVIIKLLQHFGVM